MLIKDCMAIEIAFSPDDVGIVPIVERAYIEAYSNVREQGYCIRNGVKKVCFSECRNTDQIVVYTGNDIFDFEMSGNVPSDAIYRNARYFDYGNYDVAAKFIVDFLTEKDIVK